MKTNEQDSHEFTDEELYEGIVNDFEDFEVDDFTASPYQQPYQFTEKSIIFTAIEIENFINAIASTSELGFKDNGNLHYHPQANANLPCWEAQPIGQEYYSKLKQFASIYNPVLAYSPKVTLFLEIFNEIELGNTLLPEDPNQLGYSPTKSAQGAFIFNYLVQRIRQKCTSEPFKSKQFARTQQAKRNFESCTDYTEALFKHKASRFLIVRVDLGYYSKARDGITLQMAQIHMERFLNNSHKNSIFEHQCGYIRKLEYGSKKRYHFHLMMFFHGSWEIKDVHKAFEIGEYWKNAITKGAGCYYNCNQSKNRYKRLGIGMITHDDQVMRSNLLYAISYLCKSEQSVQVKDNSARVKSLVRGIMPKAKSSNAGRPRKNATPIMPSNRYQAGPVHFTSGSTHMKTGLI